MKLEIQEYDEHDDTNDENLTLSGDGYCIDGVKGGLLPMDLIKEGRRSEKEGFAERRVYEVKPRREATAKGSNILGSVEWIPRRQAK